MKRKQSAQNVVKHLCKRWKFIICVFLNSNWFDDKFEVEGNRSKIYVEKTTYNKSIDGKFVQRNITNYLFSIYAKIELKDETNAYIAIGNGISARAWTFREEKYRLFMLWWQ